MEPFERGYGHTLGNALRRVLLSSMVGYAPTEVTIAGVLHEYSTHRRRAGRRRPHHAEPEGRRVSSCTTATKSRSSLRKEGEGPVTAGDIETPHDVEIINPDHVIAHLSSGGKLDMQIKVEKGRGYVPGNVRRYGDEPTKSIGRIVLDASFSPVSPRQLHGRKRPRRAAHRPRQAGDGDRDQRRHLAGRSDPLSRRKILVEQLAVFAQLEGTDRRHVRPAPSRDAAVRSDPAAPGRRARAHGAFGELPEGREHLLHRRPDPAHGKRAAEDAEPGPQVAERDQGSAGFARPDARREARELAAAGFGQSKRTRQDNGAEGRSR